MLRCGYQVRRVRKDEATYEENSDSSAPCNFPFWTFNYTLTNYIPQLF